MKKPDYFRSGDTFYRNDGDCDEAECDRRCTFPKCCAVSNACSSNASADAYQRNLELMRKKVQQVG